MGTFSCKKEDAQTVPIDTSISISGYVAPFDEYENPIADSSGCQVTIRGTSIAVITNPAGAWSVTTTMGNPTLVFSKQGFATRWLTWRLHSGQNNIGEVRIGKNPTWNVTELQVFSDSINVRMAGRVSSPASPGRFRNVILFISESRTVSSDPEDYHLYYDRTTVPAPATFFVTPEAFDANYFRLSHGTRAYVAAYGATPYFGVDTSALPRSLLSGLSVTASIDSFTVP